MMQHVIVGCWLMAIGVVLFWKPDQLWKMSDAWKNSGDKRISDAYRMVLRVVGTVLFVGGLMTVMFGH